MQTKTLYQQALSKSQWISWLTDNIDKYSYPDLTKEFNNLFNQNINWEQCRNLCLKLGIKKTKSYSIRNEYTQDEVEWLKENYKIDNLVSEFNKKFNSNRKYKALLCKIERLGLKRVEYKYDEEQKNFIKEYWDRIDYADDFVTAFNNKFNRSVNYNYLREKAYKMGLKRARHTTRLKYKNGDERERSGVVLVRVSEEYRGGRNADRKGWVRKSRYVYEQYHNVKLEDDEHIVFLDGNDKNFAIENLRAIKLKDKVKLLTYGWYGKSIITEAGIEVIKAERQIKEF